MRVLIADDHPIVRRGIVEILQDAFSDAEITEAGDSREAYHLGLDQDWDLVILDITMPGRDGLALLTDLKQAKPRMPILILSVHPEDQFARRVLRAGGAGYVTKDRAPNELVVAARKALDGGTYVSPLLAETLAEDLSGKKPARPHDALSDREFQVLRLIADGKTVSEIATGLSLSVKTVSTYRTRILTKLGLNTNAELMRYAMDEDLRP